MADERLELYIETLTGTAFELQVSPLETIMSIKAKIQHLEGIPVSQQHLIWRSQELDNEFSLQDYCIQDGCTLKLVLGMRGGPINTRRALEGKNPAYAMAEIFDAERQDMLDGRPLTVVLLHDGDKVHWYTVIEEDESAPPSRCPSCDSDEESMEREPSAGRQLENQIMQQKMALLQKSLKSMGLVKKSRKKKVKVSPSPSVLSHRETPQDSGFLPPISQGPMLQMKRPNLPGTSSQKNSPMPVERLPAISSASRVAALNDGRETNSGKKHLSEASNHFPCCCCCCNGCSCGRKASFGTIRRRASMTSPQVIPRDSPAACVSGDPPPCRKGQALTAIRIKDSYRFSSMAGTPVTAHRHLAELDKWMDNRPKTTPPLENIVLPHQLRTNHHHHHNHNHPYNHYKNHIIGKSVQEVGVRNQKLVRGPSPGAIVAAGLKALKSSKLRSTNSNLESVSKVVVKLEDGERVGSASKLPPIKAKKKGKRCTWCNKKTGLATSYNCRCGKNYCSTHRYPEVHHCSHDFKSEGRRLLQLSNPVITAPKLPKI